MMTFYRCSNCGLVFCFPSDQQKAGQSHSCGSAFLAGFGKLEPIYITVTSRAQEYSEAGGEMTGIDVTSEVSIDVE